MGTQGTSSNAGRARRERELGWEYTNRGSSYCIAIKSIFCLFVCLNQLFCKFRCWIPPWAQFGSAHLHSRGSPDARDPACLPARLRCPWRDRGTQGWPKMFLSYEHGPGRAELPPSPGGSSAQLQTLLLPEDFPSHCSATNPMDSSWCKEYLRV